jgi:tetratricopeptide (TPR) repeat protein
MRVGGAVLTGGRWRCCCHLLGLVVVMLFAAEVSAAGADEVARLLNQGKAAEAYQRASELLAQWEGDPDFDLQYGIAAIDSGHLSEGVFALERVLLLRPNDHQARLELARGYFLLEEDDRAREEFERVLAQDPPEGVKENIRPFLTAIRAREGRFRTSTSAYVELGFGYDSNINAGPDDPQFTTPTLGTGTLSDDSVSDADWLLDVAVGGSIRHPLRPGLSLFAAGRANQRFHLDGRLEPTDINAQAGVVSQKGKDSFRGMVHGQKYLLDGEDYRDMLGVAGEWQHMLNLRTRMSVFGQYAQLDYPGQPDRDSGLLVGGGGLVRALDGRFSPLLGFGLFIGRERPEQDNVTAHAEADRNLYGLNLSLQLAMSPAWRVEGSVRLQQSDYRGEHPVFEVKRQDTYAQGEVGLVWSPKQHWRLRISVSHADNDSNIPINDYARTQAIFRARYEFL